jgi:hypothetical protein
MATPPKRMIWTGHPVTRVDLSRDYVPKKAECGKGRLAGEEREAEQVRKF